MLFGYRLSYRTHFSPQMQLPAHSKSNTKNKNSHKYKNEAETFFFLFSLNCMYDLIPFDQLHSDISVCFLFFFFDFKDKNFEADKSIEMRIVDLHLHNVRNSPSAI